ncbi:MAG: hypothetical protein V3V11_05150 [Vicinamibacteria bacterium]
MARDKVKRAFVWIRKSLRIIDRTTLPGEILGEIRPTLDTFGWERFNEPESSSVSSANVNFIVGPAVPEGFLRYVLAASVETNAAILNETIWIDWSAGGVVTGLIQPFLAPPRDLPGGEVRVGLERPIVMREGDTLRGRCNPTMAGGERVFINQRFVDIEIGEYIPAV